MNKEDNTVDVAIPKTVEIQYYDEFINEIGISMGIWQMFTTHEWHIYGENLGEMHTELVNFIRDSDRTYHRERQNNPWRKKYQDKKARLEARIHDYINYSLSIWQRGYIRKRFTRKCSRCRAEGIYVKDVFRCSKCGYETDKKRNAA
ncbi:MAG: hypothetical protein HDR03_11255 [Lachnospiraceae bacterium]|nr:hypothetical protein [Lachnospiraceae bacterium]